MQEDSKTFEVAEQKLQERAILVGMLRRGRKRWEAEESLGELRSLVETAGARVIAAVLQERERPSPTTYFGRGKVEELRGLMGELGANLVVSDGPLTPIQERNLERALGVKVLDRTAVILDIFAQHARTREGKLQVELAQLNYLLPRLVGQWKHLERLGGGIGTRGPGETQLESDRRIIRRRIQKVRGELRSVQTHRGLLRARRRDTGLTVVAMVGYTNAGKTTLLNRLTGSAFPTADQLFVTLDPATRTATGIRGSRFVLSDTVGFIQQLPPQLVAAFRATLEELEEANLLVHVVDASSPHAREQMRAVQQVLSELGLGEKPILTVFNKLDRQEGVEGLRALEGSGESGVAVSAKTGEGLGLLLSRIRTLLRANTVRVRVTIPYARQELLAFLHENSTVISTQYGVDGVIVEAELPRRRLGQLSGARVEPLRPGLELSVSNSQGQAAV